MTGVNNKLCNAILTPTLSNKTMHIYKSTKENVSSGATRTRAQWLWEGQCLLKDGLLQPCLPLFLGADRLGQGLEATVLYTLGQSVRHTSLHKHPVTETQLVLH